MKQIKIIFFYTLAIISLNIHAQETTVLSHDTLEREILKMLNETKWKYWYYHSDKIKGGTKEVLGKIKIENKSLVLNFKKVGVVSVSLVDNKIDCNDSIAGVFITTNWGSKGGWGLNISHLHKLTTENQLSEETKQAKKQTLKLYELIRNYHKIFDEVAIKEAKEFEELQLMAQKKLEEFKKTVDDHNKLTAKQTMSEEQRKYIVQANALNEKKITGKHSSYSRRPCKLTPFLILLPTIIWRLLPHKS